MTNKGFVCLVFLMLSRLFIAALWSRAGKGLTSLILLVMFIVFFFTFPCGILGQVWYLIVSFPDLCRLSYFDTSLTTNNKNNSVEMLAISLKTVILRYIFPSTIVRINN